MDNKQIALYALGGLVLALLIFHAGVVVGARHGFFNERVPGPGHRGLPHGFVEGGHGAVGTVGSIATSSLTLVTRAGTGEAVVLTASTTYRGVASATTSGALAAGERVVVLGTRDAQGRLVADVIRIFSR